MIENNRNTSLWRFFDGAASVSVSMLLSVAFNACASCAGAPALGYLNELTNRGDGIIITATLLLFPTTAALYGVFKMFFAAKEAVERKARERRRQAREHGRKEGIREERKRIGQILQEQGVELTPELARRLAGDDE